MPELDLAEKHLQQLLALLHQYVPDCEVWAYGSRVTGEAHEGSDLDLVVRQPLALSETQPALDELRAALQNSTLPMLVDAHDWASLPPAFHAQISARHVVLQSAA